MTGACPICDSPLENETVLCQGCGFPSALSADASQALAEPFTSAPGRIERNRGAGSAALQPLEPKGTDAQAELCDQVAREVRSTLVFFQQLGGESPDIVNEMSQAALAEADGHTSEALVLLRGLERRINVLAQDLFDRRVEDIEVRQKVLLNEGVGADFSSESARIRVEFESVHRSAALSLLQVIDGRLSRIESDWRGLRGLLRQIDALRDAAAALGQEPPEVNESLERIREMLRRSPIDTETLDTIAQLAASALMLLHENLPTIIQDELDRHGLVLSKLPAEDESTLRARTLLADTSRHLRKGHLAEASQQLRELREAMKEFGPVGPSTGWTGPASTEPAGGPSSDELDRAPVPSTPADQLERLLKKARDLAGRIRTLPPDSEVGYEAAQEIRHATDLLRAKRLEEAELTLSRLMRTLDSEKLRGT
jgi:hypothetical protein